MLNNYGLFEYVVTKIRREFVKNRYVYGVKLEIIFLPKQVNTMTRVNFEISHHTTNHGSITSIRPIHSDFFAPHVFTKNTIHHIIRYHFHLESQLSILLIRLKFIFFLSALDKVSKNVAV